MPEDNDLKKEVKEPLKNLVKEISGDIFYRIAKAGTKRAINELKKELKDKSLRGLQKKLETLSEEKLGKLLDESARRPAGEITRQGMEKEKLIKQIEQGFRQGLKKKLLLQTKVSALKIAALTTVCIIVVGAGAYAAIDRPEPGDTIPPKVMVSHTPRTPQPGQRITFIAEADDNTGIDRIELLVNGGVVMTTGSSPCVFEGGPYNEGSTVRYGAYAYDKAGNRAWSGEQSLRIPVSVRRPDLVIVKVWHEWVKPGSGICIIHYVIQNRGDGEAGSSFTYLRKGTQVWEDPVSALEPGQTSERGFPPVEMSIEAGFEVELLADGGNAITEYDEKNNPWIYSVQGIIQ